MMEDQMVNCRTILCSQGEDDHFLSSRKWSTPIWTNPNLTTPAQKKYEMDSSTNTLAFPFSKNKSCILQEEIWKLENEKSDWNNWRQQKLHSAGGWKWSANGKISDWKKVELEHVASCDVDQSNEHPLGHVLSKLAALGGWKEKFPAYRGSVVPTHFQEWVGEPDYVIVENSLIWWIMMVDVT